MSITSFLLIPFSVVLLIVVIDLMGHFSCHGQLFSVAAQVHSVLVPTVTGTATPTKNISHTHLITIILLLTVSQFRLHTG